MNKILLPALLLSSLLNAHNITINIEGIENKDGKLYIGLYDKEEGFREVDQTYKKGIENITTTPTMTYTFSDVPTGNYAISIFHDENSNGEIDSNILGIPQEAYGFSNNNRHMFSPATFEESTIEVNQDTTLTITLGK